MCIRDRGNTKVNPAVTGLAYHSEKVLPGMLFVCIKGFKTDGHRFLDQAKENGAVAAVVEKIQPQVKLPQFRVTDSRRALATLADCFYGHPSRKLKMIGITASNGKTTTSFMTNAILEEHQLKTGLIGTVIVKAGTTIRPAVLTPVSYTHLDVYKRQLQSFRSNLDRIPGRFNDQRLPGLKGKKSPALFVLKIISPGAVQAKPFVKKRFTAQLAKVLP